MEERLTFEETVETTEQQPVKNPEKLNFDIGQVSEVVAIVQALFFAGPLIPEALGFLRRKRKQMVVMETPLGRISIEPTRELSDDEIREMLKKLTGVL
ncbi:hypothetical protein J2808_004354 [Pseudarthrobacter sulfonivorans]|nr:hypothetical protein [Pseudarthrobacter sulfonivorans]